MPKNLTTDSVDIDHATLNRWVVKFSPLIAANGQSKYLNNVVEQDHRFIKRITRPMLGFKGFHSAAATLAGIETAHMIRKGQFGQTGVSPFTQVAALSA